MCEGPGWGQATAEKHTCAAHASVVSSASACFAAASAALLRSSCAVSCFARDSSCPKSNAQRCQKLVLTQFDPELGS